MPSISYVSRNIAKLDNHSVTLGFRIIHVFARQFWYYGPHWFGTKRCQTKIKACQNWSMPKSEHAKIWTVLDVIWLGVKMWPPKFLVSNCFDAKSKLPKFLVPNKSGPQSIGLPLLAPQLMNPHWMTGGTEEQWQCWRCEGCKFPHHSWRLDSGSSGNIKMNVFNWSAPSMPVALTLVRDETLLRSVARAMGLSLHC